MSADAYSPITTSREIQVPLGHRIYTTSREVPAEYPIPLIGATMSAQLGSGSPYAAHIIVGVSETPDNGKKRLVLEHTALPGTGVQATTYEQHPYTFPTIYPQNIAPFLVGSRERSRVVIARVTHEYSLPAVTPFTTWLTDDTIWDKAQVVNVVAGSTPMSGPFEVHSVLAQVATIPWAAVVAGTPGSVGEYVWPGFVNTQTVNDAFTITSWKDAVSLYWNVPASIPSQTQYNTMITNKRELMASRTIIQWYGNILCRRTVWVRAQ